MMGKISENRDNSLYLHGLQQAYNFTSRFYEQHRLPLRRHASKKSCTHVSISWSIDCVVRPVFILLFRNILAFVGTLLLRLPGHLGVNTKLSMTSSPWSAVGEFRCHLCCSPVEKKGDRKSMDWVEADDSIRWQINTKEPDRLFPLIIIMVLLKPMGNWGGGGERTYNWKLYWEVWRGCLDCGEIKKRHINL